MKVRLTKLKDEKFNGKHPNDINENYIKEGFLRFSIEKGKSIHISKGINDFLMTSSVTDIIEKDDEDNPTLVRTNNSIYKIEYI